MRRRLTACAVALLLGGCGGGGDDPKPDTTTGARTEPTRTEPEQPPADETAPLGADGVALGITEPNPNFVWPPGMKDVPEPFAQWQKALDEIRPSVYRLVVDWASLAPERGQEPALDGPRDGCARDRPPCAGYGGLREQFKAVKAQQEAKEDDRWQVLIVFSGTPEWAASEPSGCERPNITPRSRAPRDEALPAYTRFVEQVAALAREERVDVRYWSAWNEPNHPFGLSPQRVSCSRRADSAAAAPYGRLVRALKAALDSVPGDQQIVLGETAGLTRRTEQATTVSELIRELGDDVVCAGPIWSQHGYVGGGDPTDDAVRALKRRGCREPHRLWVTETGAGGPRRGARRRLDAAGLRATCERYADRLRRWHEGPNVDVAVQYTLREDDVFPTGLVSTDLDRAYPVLDLMKAWGGDRATGAPPPRGGCG